MARHRLRRPHQRRVGPTIRSSLVVFVTMLVVTGARASVAAAPCWHPPVDAPIVDPYRAPVCRWCPGNRGIEYRTVPGTAVRAVAAGTVTFAGNVAGLRYVVVQHADGRRATYGHLASVGVDAGDLVVARSVVGRASAVTHFGLRDKSGYVDPTPMLGRLERVARLVPLDGVGAAPSGPPRLRCRGAEISPFPGANAPERR
jgi:murein DD-endopeptidase MepM/ murein hydrolase activator NlpD